MRATNANRRTKKTRHRLHKALLSRILEKPYESITVQEILDRADIGRSTFYTHFRGKDELLVAGFQSFKASLDALEASSAGSFTRPHERIVACSRAMFEHAREYRDVHRALNASRAEVIVHRHLRAVFVDIIGRRVESELRRARRRDACPSSELLTLFLVSTQVALLNWWLAARNPMSVDEIDAAYRRLVVPVLISIFGAPDP